MVPTRLRYVEVNEYFPSGLQSQSSFRGGVVKPG